jgi:hypothetical protein
MPALHDGFLLLYLSWWYLCDSTVTLPAFMSLVAAAAVAVALAAAAAAAAAAV